MSKRKPSPEKTIVLAVEPGDLAEFRSAHLSHQLATERVLRLTAEMERAQAQIPGARAELSQAAQELVAAKVKVKSKYGMADADQIDSRTGRIIRGETKESG